MAMTLPAYLLAQDGAVLDSFIDDNWRICAGASAASQSELAASRGRSVHPLGTLGDGEARLVRRGDHSELWVRARRSDDGGPFFAFAHAVYGYAPSDVPKGYNVDHLFNKERVQTAPKVDPSRHVP